MKKVISMKALLAGALMVTAGLAACSKDVNLQNTTWTAQSSETKVEMASDGVSADTNNYTYRHTLKFDEGYTGSYTKQIHCVNHNGLTTDNTENYKLTYMQEGYAGTGTISNPDISATNITFRFSISADGTVMDASPSGKMVQYQKEED